MHVKVWFRWNLKIETWCWCLVRELERPRRRGEGDRPRRSDACSCSRRANTSARSSARASGAGGVGAVAMWKLWELLTGVEAISIRLSARSACCSRGRSGVEAKTMRTWDGRRCMKSSWSRADSTAVEPCNCCKWRRNCDGVRSPSRSSDRSWRIRFCSLAYSLVMSCCLRWVNGSSVGGCNRRSRTSWAYSCLREAMTSENFVVCAVMPRRANWTSTCANHSSGSPGQNGGSFRETAEIEEGTDGADDRVGGDVVSEGDGRVEASELWAWSCGGGRPRPPPVPGVEGADIVKQYKVTSEKPMIWKKITSGSPIVGNYGRWLQIPIPSHISQTEYKNACRIDKLLLLQVVNEERVNKKRSRRREKMKAKDNRCREENKRAKRRVNPRFYSECVCINRRW